MTQKFEDFLFTDKYPEARILKFSEYRKGSSEYGVLFQDLMMLLRLKRKNNEDEIIISKKELKNIDIDKLIKLSHDIRTMRKLGMSFDIEIMNDKIRFYNLNKVNKESRPWENIDFKR